MPPDLEFHGQPFDDEHAAGSFVLHTLGDDNIVSLDIAVAWARFGGLARISEATEAFRVRGGRVRAVLGIDAGGASRPGLLKALALFDEVFVFYDPSGRTFHPKLYMAAGPTEAMLFVGSSNATAGGLFFNYEASLKARFRLPDEQDHQALVAASGYFDLLLKDTEICQPLTAALIEDLVDDPRYPVAETERRRRAGDPPVPDGASGHESDAIGGTDGPLRPADPLFGASRHLKPTIPPLSNDAAEELAALEREVEEPGDQAGTGEDGERPSDEPRNAAPTAAEVWFKTLSHADAQQPTSPTTNPTGHLKLTKAGHDIDWRTWFREELFGAADWTETRDGLEEAVVPIEVTVAGVDVETVELRISHAAHREAGQRNVPTWLHWGPQLMGILRRTDHSGERVTIKRADNGTYRLGIAP